MIRVLASDEREALLMSIVAKGDFRILDDNVAKCLRQKVRSRHSDSVYNVLRVN